MVCSGVCLCVSLALLLSLRPALHRGLRRAGLFGPLRSLLLAQDQAQGRGRHRASHQGLGRALHRGLLRSRHRTLHQGRQVVQEQGQGQGQR
jgi:hypothetical protein